MTEGQRAGSGPSPPPLLESAALPTPRPLAFGTGRGWVSVALSHPGCGPLLGGTRTPIQPLQPVNSWTEMNPNLWPVWGDSAVDVFHQQLWK